MIIQMYVRGGGDASGASLRASTPAEVSDRPLSLHIFAGRQGRIRGADEKTLCDAGSRATEAFYPALSRCYL